MSGFWTYMLNLKVLNVWQIMAASVEMRHLRTTFNPSELKRRLQCSTLRLGVWKYFSVIFHMEAWSSHCELETSKGGSWTSCSCSSVPFHILSYTYDADSNAALPAAAGEICRVNAETWPVAQHSEWNSSRTEEKPQNSWQGAKSKAKCLMLVMPSHAPFQTAQLELKFKSSNNNINVDNKMRKIIRDTIRQNLNVSYVLSISNIYIFARIWRHIRWISIFIVTSKIQVPNYPNISFKRRKTNINTLTTSFTLQPSHFSKSLV